ncbi:MAG: HAMP domain-containing protein, partial [Chloroflexi bacterium]|nr:HAMP domain-containing protein [Chloroflexota bacterium]
MTQLTTPLADRQTKQRQISTKQIILFGAALTIVLVVIFIIAYIQLGAWQVLAVALTYLAVGFAFPFAYYFTRRGNLNLTGYILLGVVIVNYAAAQMLLANATLYLIIGGILLVIFLGSLTLPNRWYIWLPLAILFIGIRFIDDAPLFPRYDITQSTLLSVVLPSGAFAGGAANFLLLIRVLRASSIRMRLLAAFAAAVLLPALVTASSDTIIGNSNAENETINRLQAVAAIKESQINAWAGELKSNLDIEMKLDEEGRLLTLVKSPPDSAEFKSAYSTVGKRLRQAIILRQLYEELFVIDSNGVIILSTNIFQEGKTLRNEPFFQQILQEVSLQPPAFSETLGHFSVLATRPITEQGKPLGALLGRAGLAVLDGFVSDRNGMGRTGEIYLVNPGFVLLTETHFGTPGSTFIRTNATNAAINRHTTGAEVYSSYRATIVVGHYRWLPDLQLALIAEQEQSEAFENSRFLLLVGSSISAVLITIAMIAAFFITRSISNPIVEMAQVAEQIEAGNLDRTVNIHRDDEIGTLATAFNNMITRLRGLIGSLEMRVADRTKALAASTEVSRRLSTILDEQSLVSAVVDEVQSAFNYYHAHIYLLDAAGENLIMMGGTGDIGRLMLMRGHSIPVGRGLVGRAAAKSETVLVPDVSKDPQWLPNTLLPDTRAEAAVPITLGSKVLGVLDIQHNIVNGLQPDDIDLLQAIASQVAIGLQNARSYTQAQRQADYESMLNAINE